MTKAPYIHVTDHALVRYLERVHGVDMEALRKRIGRKVRKAVSHGANGVRIKGVSFKLIDNRVITVRPPYARSRNKNRKLRSKGRRK
jgi:hypothetical protein